MRFLTSFRPAFTDMSSARSYPQCRRWQHRGFCDRRRPPVNGDSYSETVSHPNCAHHRRYPPPPAPPPLPPPQQQYHQVPFDYNSRPPLPPPSYFHRPDWERPQQCYGQPTEFHQPPPLFQQPLQGYGQFQPNFRTGLSISRPHPPPRPADFRSWTYATSQPTSLCERFKVLSYNILADYLAMEHRYKLYPHIPYHILSWEWRKRRLMIEFGLWTPDVMCLQEVDKFNDLQEELRLQGYSGLWKMRTGNAFDGCAIFWRSNRFQLLHEEQIEYRQFGLRDNVAQICVLESTNRRPTGNECTATATSSRPRPHKVVICNIHVLYNPKRGEVKLAQVRILLNRAYQISEKWNGAPVIVCGDFNCTPKSPLYNFISQQKITFSGIARNQISGQYSASLDLHRPSAFSAYYRAKNDNQKKLQVGPENSLNIKEHPIFEDKVYGEQSRYIGEVDGVETLNASFRDSATESDVVNQSHACLENHDHPSRSPDVVNQSHAYLENQDLPSRSPDVVNQSHACLENQDLPSTSPYGGDALFHTVEHMDAKLSYNVDIDCSSPEFLSKHVSPFNVDALDAQKGANDSFSCSGIVSLSEVPLDSSLPLVSRSAISHGGSNRPASDSELSDNEHQEANHVNQVPLPDDHTEIAKSNKPSDGATDVQSSQDLVAVATEMSSLEIVAEELPRRSSKDTPAKTSGEHEKTVYTCNGLDNNEERGNSILSSDACILEENSDPGFLKELLGDEDEYGSIGDIVCTASSGQPCTETQEDSFEPVEEHVAEDDRHSNDPSTWTPVEIGIASGSPDRDTAEHHLKLRSAYIDVEDYGGTRDSSREPQVTSYNRLFMGTVDYIWYSEGLQTVKVLDTIPRHVLEQTPGFPTKKWGSDHLALSCEFAFTEGSQE